MRTDHAASPKQVVDRVVPRPDRVVAACPNDGRRQRTRRSTAYEQRVGLVPAASRRGRFEEFVVVECRDRVLGIS
jgi:hypothetical protein